MNFIVTLPDCLPKYRENFVKGCEINKPTSNMTLTVICNKWNESFNIETYDLLKGLFDEVRMKPVSIAPLEDGDDSSERDIASLYDRTISNNSFSLPIRGEVCLIPVGYVPNAFDWTKSVREAYRISGSSFYGPTEKDAEGELLSSWMCCQADFLLFNPCIRGFDRKIRFYERARYYTQRDCTSSSLSVFTNKPDFPSLAEKAEGDDAKADTPPPAKRAAKKTAKKTAKKKSAKKATKKIAKKAAKTAKNFAPFTEDLGGPVKEVELPTQD